MEVTPPGKAALKTSYFVDDTGARVTRLEFVIGETSDLFGKTVSNVEAWVFSDFRVVQGVLTPFKIERYLNDTRIEETQFTSVRYNASVKDDAFKP